MTGLEQVLADARGDAALLRHHGHILQADSMERVCVAVADVMRDYLDWLSEDEARSQSGWGIPRLRSHFAEWEAMGMAKLQGTGRRARRQYRRCIVPQRARELVSYEAGRRSA